MSWDVFLMDFPAGVASVADLPRDFVPPPLGRRDEVISRIRARIPEVDFRDPAWGRLRGSGFSIELNLGQNEVAHSLMLHVRGGPEAMGAVRAIAEALESRALDVSTGDLLDFDAPDAEAGFAAWRRFRDQVVPAARREDDGEPTTH